MTTPLRLRACLRNPLVLAVALSAILVSRTAASFPAIPLHPDLGANRSAFDVLVSPDHEHVVFTVADIELFGPGHYAYELDSIYSAPLTGAGPVVRLDDPLDVPKTISRSAFGVPLVSPDSRSVVFVSIHKDTHAVTITRSAIDGSERTILPTFGGPLPYEPNWLNVTPDSQHVIYRLIDGDVVSIPVQGGSPVVLNPPLGPNGFTHHLYHAPNASAVMFVVGENPDSGNRELYSVAPDGTNPRILSPTASNGDNSPVIVNSVRLDNSSTHLLYQAGDLFDHRKQNLFSVPIAGGTPVQLNANSPGYFTLNGYMTPDGTRVVYDRWLAPFGEADYFLVPVTGGTPQPLIAPLAPGETVDWPVFTPDSQYALFTVNAPLPRLERVSLTTGERLQLNAPTAPGSLGVRGVRVSPDGNTIAYSEDHDADGIEDLFLVPLSGGAPIPVNDPLPAFGNLGYFDFSPDGRWLVYHADTVNDGIFRAFITRIDSSLPGFGLDLFDTVEVSLDASEHAFVRFLTGNRALLEMGDASSRELFLLHIPEPASLSLAALLACCLATRRNAFARRKRKISTSTDGWGEN